MIKEVVDERMGAIGLPYAYWKYKHMHGKHDPLYFVGERIEAPQTQEDGARSGTFVLSGWSRNGIDPLDKAEEKIRDEFDDMRVSNALGTCTVNYSHASEIPSDVEGMCRVEFTLNYTEWS